MARIFISYRREDSEIWAARLEDALKRAFPADQVFRDVTAIAPGVDFVAALETALRETAAAIVVIGPSWLSATDRKGNRRLAQPGDFVRQEVAACLARNEVRVFPVLVQGAEMAGEDELPEPLKPLWRRNALDLTVRHWEQDVAQLVQRLKEVPGLAVTPPPAASAAPPLAVPVQPAPTPRRRPPLRWVAFAAAGIAMAVAFAWLLPEEPTPRRPVVELPPAPASKSTVERVPPARAESRPSAETGVGSRSDALTRAAEAGRELLAADTGARSRSDAMPPAPSPRGAEPKAEARPATAAQPPAAPTLRAEAPASRPAAPPPLQRIMLRGQNSYATNLGLSSNALELTDTVRTSSGGRITFEVMPVGAVVRSSDLIDAVAKGTLDFAWAAPGQFGGKDLAFALIDSPPFGPEPAGYLRWRTDPAVQPVIDALYARHGVRALPCGVVWLADLWTIQPLRNAADLRGRKVRASGSMHGEIYKRAGATYVAMPSGDLVPAIERAMVDAVQYLDAASGVALKLHEHARALYYPGRLAPAGGIDLLLNPSKWEALDADARRVIEQACERSARQMLAAGERAQRGAIAQVALRGVAVQELPRDVEEALRRAWRDVAAEKGSDPTFRRLHETLARYSTVGR